MFGQIQGQLLQGHWVSMLRPLKAGLIFKNSLWFSHYPLCSCQTEQLKQIAPELFRFCPPQIKCYHIYHAAAPAQFTSSLKKRQTRTAILSCYYQFCVTKTRKTIIFYMTSDDCILLPKIRLQKYSAISSSQTKISKPRCEDCSVLLHIPLNLDFEPSQMA